MRSNQGRGETFTTVAIAWAGGGARVACAMGTVHANNRPAPGRARIREDNMADSGGVPRRAGPRV